MKGLFHIYPDLIDDDVFDTDEEDFISWQEDEEDADEAAERAAAAA